MRILLIGGGFVNKGGEAMALTVKEELARRLGGDASFLMERRASRLPDGYIEAAEDEGLVPVEYSASLSERMKALARQAARAPGRALYLARHRGPAWKAQARADRADAFVDLSGYAYADKWGPKKAREMNLLVHEAQRQGKPYVVLPQTWGPFSNAELRTLVKDACRRADLFFARDTTSQQHLAGLLDKPPAQIPRSPDLAFAFDPGEAAKQAADQFFEERGLDSETRPTMAVAPNMRVFERNDGIGSNNAYAKVLIDVGRACLHHGIDVLLLPHEIKPARAEISDDRLLCNLVETALRGHGSSGSGARVVAQEEVRSARVTKALVRRCDLMLGSRFHSIVAALSQAVPAVAIGWSFKYQRLMGAFGLEHFVIDHNDMNVHGVKTLVEEAWGQREETRAHLKAQLPEVREDVGRTFDRVARTLHARQS